MLPKLTHLPSVGAAARWPGWRRVVAPGLLLGLLLSSIPIQADVRADHAAQRTVLATVTPLAETCTVLCDPLTAPRAVIVGRTFDVTAIIQNHSSLNILEVSSTLQPPAGLAIFGPATQGLGDLPAHGSVKATWQVVAEGEPGSYIILATTTGIVASTGQQISVQDTVNVEVLPAHGDRDGDGISNQLDTHPIDFSHKFSDHPLGGKSKGSVRASGQQVLTIEDDTPAGVIITAEELGGELASSVQVCDGIAELSIRAGATVLVTCGSAIIEVIQGTVEIAFFGSDGKIATTTLIEGNELTFEQEDFSITAASTNEGPVVIFLAIDGAEREFTLVPGTTIRFGDGVLLAEMVVNVVPSAIKLDNNGIIPVTILGDDAISVTAIDLESLELGPGRAALVGSGQFYDIDNDSDLDLLVRFHTDDTGLTLGVTEVCLSGKTTEGISLIGCDTVTTFAIRIAKKITVPILVTPEARSKGRPEGDRRGKGAAASDNNRGGKQVNGDDDDEHEPPGKSENPPGKSDDAPGKSENPSGKSDDPPGKSEDPSSKSDDPPGKSENPPGQSEDPPGKSENPPGKSEDPSSNSEDPPGQSEDPPGKGKGGKGKSGK